MKKRFYIKAALGLFMASALFSSCLKDTARAPVFTNDVPVVDFPVAAFSSALQTATIAAASSTNSLNILVSVGAQHDYSTPTSVTVIVDQASLTATYGTTYTLLPASVYTISSLTLSINPGIQQRIENVQPVVGTPLALPSASEGLLSFVINTAAFQALDQTKTYVLPLTITGASGNGAIVDQFHTVYYKIAIK